MLVTVNVMMNMTANKTTIVGAGALSIKKDSQTPVIETNIDMPGASRSEIGKRCVRSTARAPGAMRREKERMIPTASSVAKMGREPVHSSPK